MHDLLGVTLIGASLTVGRRKSTGLENYNHIHSYIAQQFGWIQASTTGRLAPSFHAPKLVTVEQFERVHIKYILERTHEVIKTNFLLDWVNCARSIYMLSSLSASKPSHVVHHRKVHCAWQAVRVFSYIRTRMFFFFPAKVYTRMLD